MRFNQQYVRPLDPPPVSIILRFKRLLTSYLFWILWKDKFQRPRFDMTLTKNLTNYLWFYLVWNCCICSLWMFGLQIEAVIKFLSWIHLIWSLSTKTVLHPTNVFCTVYWLGIVLEYKNLLIIINYYHVSGRSIGSNLG